MITGIILASGYSKRMGKDKLLIEIEGEKIIEKVIKACVKSKLNKVVLIYRKKQIKQIGEKYKIKTIYNKDADKGQSESMKLGISHTDDNSSYMFVVGDQPFINSETINRLIKEYKGSNSTITIPYYNGKRGMPIIISSIYKRQLLNVEGDKGGRDIIKKNFRNADIVHIKNERIGIDIDSPQDLNKIESSP